MSTRNLFNTEVTEKSKDEWLTPPHIIQALGKFDLDPCAPIKRPWEMAAEHYTIEDNGLMKPWNGRVWLNPPYGRETFRWLSRLAEHAGGGIALIFARTETDGFHRQLWEKAHSVFFFEGRLAFYHVDGRKGGSSNAPSCLVAYTPADASAIFNSGLTGKFVMLSNRSVSEAK